jgi:hypothetical protein
MTRARGEHGRVAGWLLPLVLVELVLLVAVAGGVSALRDRGTLAHGETVRATVTGSSSYCKTQCTYTSYGDYRLGSTTQRHVELRCCAPSPLTGTVAVRVDPSSPRRPVLAADGGSRDLVLGGAALVALVAGNALLVVRLRRRRV